MLIRVEPVLDDATQRYFVAIYFPADAARPFVTTVPRYASAGGAEQDVIAILASRASTAGTTPSDIATVADAGPLAVEKGA